MQRFLCALLCKISLFLSVINMQAESQQNTYGSLQILKNYIALNSMTIECKIGSGSDLPGFYGMGGIGFNLNLNQMYDEANPITGTGGNSYGYAFVQDPWNSFIETPFSDTTGIAGIKRKGKAYQSMVKNMNSGPNATMSMVLLGFDANGNYIPDIIANAPTEFGLYVYGTKGNLLPNFPVIFNPDDYVGLGIYKLSSGATGPAQFAFGGLGQQISETSSLIYPFVLTINWAVNPLVNPYASLTLSQLEKQITGLNPMTVQCQQGSGSDLPGFLGGSTGIGFNLNLNQINPQRGYAFVQDPWDSFIETAFSGTTGIAGVSYGSVAYQSMVANMNSGPNATMSMVLLGFDANGNYISDIIAKAPTQFGLYVYGTRGNLLSGFPVMFSADDYVGLGSYSLTSGATGPAQFVFGGLGNPSIQTSSLNYPFVLTINWIANSNPLVNSTTYASLTLTALIKQIPALNPTPVQCQNGGTDLPGFYDYPNSIGFNFNLNQINGSFGYAFVQDPWSNFIETPFSGTTGIAGISQGSVAYQSMVANMNSGPNATMNMVLLGFDASGAYIPNIIANVPTQFGLNVYDASGTVLSGFPVMFSPNDYVGLGSYTLPSGVTAPAQFTFGGLGQQDSETSLLNYPFIVTIDWIANPNPPVNPYASLTLTALEKQISVPPANIGIIQCQKGTASDLPGFLDRIGIGFNFNLNQMSSGDGYAFVEDPWSGYIKTPFSGMGTTSKGIAGVSQGSVAYQSMVANMNSGPNATMSMALLGFDANGNYIPDIIAKAPTQFGLYVYGTKGNLLSGFPVMFSANDYVGSGSYALQSTATAPALFVLGGLGNPSGASTAPLPYPFIFTIDWIANPNPPVNPYASLTLTALEKQISVPPANIGIIQCQKGTASDLPGFLDRIGIGFNFNLNQMSSGDGYAFVEDPWSGYIKTPFSGTGTTSKGIAGVSYGSVAYQSMVTNMNSGPNATMSMALLGFDANGNYIPDIIAKAPTQFGLYVYGTKGNLLSGFPVMFSANDYVGSGSYALQSTATAPALFVLGGLGNPSGASTAPLPYPFIFTIDWIANPINSVANVLDLLQAIYKEQK